MTLTLVAVAAAFGAAARYLLDHAVTSRMSAAFPWGTFAVNVTGSLALGLLAGFVTFRGLDAYYLALLGTGFLGAYTTFSTWTYETVRLLEERAWGTAGWYAVASGVVATAAAALGLWLATLGS